MSEPLSPSLQATIEARLAELGGAATVSADPGASLRPRDRSLDAWTRPDPSRLPRLSVAPRVEGEAASPEGATADLELGALLGEGGMGRVVAAFQRSLAREVAIKALRAGADPGDAIALLREAVITGSLEHPGIVPVHALGVGPDGAPLLVMKRVEGVTWRDLLGDPEHAAWGARDADRRRAHIEITKQICQTLEFAHARGVLHRDIKPENVMLGEFGETYVVDWGVAARLEATARPGGGGFAGTPCYMAPEMVSGAALDARTDVYLIGASLHEALTGAPPHLGDHLQEVLTSALTSKPASYGDDVEPELAAIARRAMAREPNDRYASPRELRLALDAHLQHRGSVRLAQEAGQRLAELDGLFAGIADDAVPTDLQRAYRLGAETRFAFVEALRSWPENTVAQGGLLRCVARLVDLELRQKHVETARALLAELEAPPEELTDRLARAERVEAERRAEEERLRALAAAQDRTHGGRQRQIALGAFMVAGGLIAGVTAIQGAVVFTVKRLVVASAALFVATLVSTFFLRKGLLGSAFNRRMTALACAAVFSIFVSRVAALYQGLTTTNALTQDLLVMMMLTTTLALTELPRIWPALIPLVAAALVTTTTPVYALPAYAIAVALVPGATILALRDRRDITAPPR